MEDFRVRCWSPLFRKLPRCWRQNLIRAPMSRITESEGIAVHQTPNNSDKLTAQKMTRLSPVRRGE
jgi:hypothetical protein